MRIKFHQEKMKTYIGIGGFLVLLAIVGALLNVRMDAILSSNIRHTLSVASQVQAGLIEVKLDSELDNLESKARHISDNAEDWRHSVQHGNIAYMRDVFVREGILDIHGHAVYGADLGLEAFPGVRESLRGNKAVCYNYNNGMLFSVPVFNGKNVRYVLYRRIDSGGIDEYFRLRDNYTLGETALVSKDGELIFSDTSRDLRNIWQEQDVKQAYKELCEDLRVHKSYARKFYLRGTPMYISASDVWQTGFVLVGVISADEATSGMHDISYLLLIVFALLSLLFIIGIYLFLVEDEEKHNLERRRTESLWRMSMQTVQTLANAIDAKDRYTNGHSERVAKYAVMLGERIGFDRQALGRLEYIALLHDVGKIGIADEILNKKGKLTEAEYKAIQSHPTIGAKILSSIKEIPDVALGAEYHHERYDGRGYPSGLKGEEIPLIARIIAVADAYDAMTSRRSYREAMPQAVVREELVNGSGTQFDPQIAKVMLAIMDEDKEYHLREQ